MTNKSMKGGQRPLNEFDTAAPMAEQIGTPKFVLTRVPRDQMTPKWHGIV